MYVLVAFFPQSDTSMPSSFSYSTHSAVAVRLLWNEAGMNAWVYLNMISAESSPYNNRVICFCAGDDDFLPPIPL